MICFKGKNVLITGAAGGIGRAAALRFARAGAHVALSDINAQALKEVESEVADIQQANSGAQVMVLRTDITDAASCTNAVDQTAARFGGIDHLVHCAGVYPESMVATMSDDAWHQLMRINLDGTFHMCRAVIPHLTADSSIVNIASIAGHRGSYSHAHYAASKGAVSSFSKSLALELAPKTRVNIVAPGIIDTAMTDDLRKQKGQALLDNTALKRFGTADDVAGVIAFLCSDLAGFMTGETVHVNGGLYIV
ncbi:SDR family oxidoreductase [Parapusillimonas sp. SGNA-6]|nr:SDR family oxidoreductase [Parapusillimonas sp. SGNA-6]